jgi:hypothetical protein
VGEIICSPVMKLKMRIRLLRDKKRRWPWDEERKGRVRMDFSMSDQLRVLRGVIGGVMTGSISCKQEIGKRRRRRERCWRRGQMRRGGKKEVGDAEIVERAKERQERHDEEKARRSWKRERRMRMEWRSSSGRSDQLSGP